MATRACVAIAATASRSLRANELREIWHDDLGTGRVAQVRQLMAESRSRSHIAGIDPASSRAPTVLADPHDVSGWWEAHRFMPALPLIRLEPGLAGR